MSTVVETYCGGEPVALFGLKPDRDAMLATAHVAAVGIGADVLAVSLETWHSTLLESPVTGRPWEPGEMETVARRHHGRERGWVSDAIVIHVANRAGDIAGAVLPYIVDKWRVQWGKPKDTISSPASG